MEKEVLTLKASSMYIRTELFCEDRIEAESSTFMRKSAMNNKPTKPFD